MLFRGLYAVALDAKGRMAIPTRFRESLASECNGELVLTIDQKDPCLMLCPKPRWEEFERKLVKAPVLDDATRRLQRLLIGHATDCQLDGNGRVLVPPLLREYASLKKDVMLLGQGNRFELWDQDTWNVMRAEWIAMGVGRDGKLPPELEQLSF